MQNNIREVTIDNEESSISNQMHTRDRDERQRKKLLRNKKEKEIEEGKTRILEVNVESKEIEKDTPMKENIENEDGIGGRKDEETTTITTIGSTRSRAVEPEPTTTTLKTTTCLRSLRPSSTSTPTQSTYQIKEINFRGKMLPILCQNENGPCPLLAICNILFLKKAIDLPPITEKGGFGVKYVLDETTKEMNKEIDYSTIIALVANYILENNNDGEKSNANYNTITNKNDNQLRNKSSNNVYLKQQIDDVMRVMPRLQYGLDVNVKFKSCTGFEFTEELAVFDSLGINLFHGWVIGDLEEGYSAVSNLSYNQAVDSILSLSTPIVTTNNTKRTTFEESLASNSDNSGSVLPDSTTSSSDYPTFGLSITGGESGYEKKSDHHHDDKNQKEAKQIREWLEETGSQMTYYGFALLRDHIQEHELGVLFRNNHFSTVFKHKGMLYILVTDQGYANVPEVTWERMDTIEGNNVLVDGNFRTVEKVASQERPVAPSSDNHLELHLTEEEALALALAASMKPDDSETPSSLNADPGNHRRSIEEQSVGRTTTSNNDNNDDSDSNDNEKKNSLGSHLEASFDSAALDREYSDEEIALQMQMEEEYTRKLEDRSKRENEASLQGLSYKRNAYRDYPPRSRHSQQNERNENTASRRQSERERRRANYNQRQEETSSSCNMM